MTEITGPYGVWLRYTTGPDPFSPDVDSHALRPAGDAIAALCGTDEVHEDGIEARLVRDQLSCPDCVAALTGALLVGAR